MVTDPISDMLIQLKNAAMVKKPTVVLPFSNLKFEIAKVLMKEGYLQNAVKRGKKTKKFLSCDIAYLESGLPKLEDVKRISKPSRRVYRKADEIHGVRQGFGLLIMSTPKGIMTGGEAKKANLGGEALFEIW